MLNIISLDNTIKFNGTFTMLPVKNAYNIQLLFTFVKITTTLDYLALTAFDIDPV